MIQRHVSRPTQRGESEPKARMYRSWQLSYTPPGTNSRNPVERADASTQINRLRLDIRRRSDRDWLARILSNLRDVRGDGDAGAARKPRPSVRRDVSPVANQAHSQPPLARLACSHALARLPRRWLLHAYIHAPGRRQSGHAESKTPERESGLVSPGFSRVERAAGLDRQRDEAFRWPGDRLREKSLLSTNRFNPALLAIPDVLCTALRVTLLG